MNEIYRDLQNISPIRLHQAFGINCYQHARGHHYPIIGIIPGMPEHEGQLQILHYFSLFPGNSSSPYAPTTEAEFKPFILHACQEDGIVIFDRKIDTEPAQNLTVGAIYFSKENSHLGLAADFHFAIRRNDGKWEGKHPFSEKKIYEELPSEIDAYKLSKYLLIPNQLPLGIQKIDPEFRTLRTTDEELRVAVVDPKLIYNGNLLAVHLQRNRAIMLHSKIEVPAPYCPADLQIPCKMGPR